MDRRAFLAGMGTVGIAVSAAGGALAETGLNVSLHGLLRVRFDDGEFQTFDGFQIQGSGGVWGRNWGGDLRTYDEDRANLGTAGGLLRQPFRIRWAEARPIGSVMKLGSKLIGQASGGSYGGVRVTVGAHLQSWDLPRTLQPMARWSGAGRTVGAMRLSDDGHVLVSLNGRPAF